MSDTRPIEEFRFGLEWEPKLAEVMTRFPWPDSEFRMADPKTVCSVCGRAVGSVNHVIEMSVSLIRPSEMVAGAHNFVPTVAWTADQIEVSRDEWRRRMANLPTPEAESAWKGIHAERMGRLHALLKKSNTHTRADIETLGCTGCLAMGLSLDDIQFLRFGLAGSGVGLPCFVPSDKFCLAHGVSGGLQDGQEQAYAVWVDKVSRPLTPQEASHDKLVSAARKSDREHGAHSLLHGHTMPKGWEEVESTVQSNAEEILKSVEALRAEGGIDDTVAAGRMQTPLFKWECDVHEKTDWSCRYCAAQAVIEGELVPVYAIEEYAKEEAVEGGIEAKSFSTNSTPEELLSEISDADLEEAPKLVIYVKVATFTRKLARD